MNDTRLESVKSFKYLWSVTFDDGSKSEIGSRIAQATAALAKQNFIRKDKNFKRPSNIKLMHSLVALHSYTSHLTFPWHDKYNSASTIQGTRRSSRQTKMGRQRQELVWSLEAPSFENLQWAVEDKSKRRETVPNFKVISGTPKPKC